MIPVQDSLVSYWSYHAYGTISATVHHWNQWSFNINLYLNFITFVDTKLNCCIPRKGLSLCHCLQNEYKLSRDMWFPTMWHFDEFHSDEQVQPPCKLRNSKSCSVSSLNTHRIFKRLAKVLIRLRVCAGYLRLYWSHIPHWWKSHVTTQLMSCS